MAVAAPIYIWVTDRRMESPCDGLYMASLDQRAQALYVGWQGAFFNASKFLALGGLMKLAGLLETRAGAFNAWSMIFVMLAVCLALLATWNWRMLPDPLSPSSSALTAEGIARTQRDVIAEFVRKPGIWLAILFIVLFRLGEGQVQTIGPLFLLEARDKGGLGLTTGQVGDIYGIAGTAAFLLGSILGGYFTAQLRLKRAMPAPRLSAQTWPGPEMPISTWIGPSPGNCGASPAARS